MQFVECIKTWPLYLNYEQKLRACYLIVLDETCYRNFVCIFSTIGGARVYGSPSVAGSPPRGWNSYAAFSWVITEEQFLQNAQVVAEKLLPFGYEVSACIVLHIQHFGRGGCSRFTVAYAARFSIINCQTCLGSYSSMC